MRAYPLSREWLALLIRRMDAVAAVYRLAALMSPGTRSRRSHVEFHRRGRFDATITLHDGRDFGVVRQGLALRRRSLYDRLRAIAEYDYTRRPDTVLILVPSVWEERLTGKFCERLNLRDSYIAVETRDALERRDLRLWRKYSWVSSSYSPSPRSPSPSSGDVTHPHFNRLFRGLMSLKRLSHGPADVIPHVWRCHCGPERAHSKIVHCLRPVEGRFTPVSATKSRLSPLCYQTQSPVHPQHRMEGAEKREPIAPRIPAQTYERSYSALRLCTLSCDSRDPMSRGRPQGGERVGAETTEQSPGDGEAGIANALHRAE